MSTHGAGIHRLQGAGAKAVDYINSNDGLVTTDTIIYISVLFATGALLFLLVYFIITLSDLECDYLNAQQCCFRLNMWVVPKLLVHVIAAVILMIGGHYWLSLINFPLAAVWAKEYYVVPSGNFGVYDPTEIHRLGQIKRHMRDVFVGVLYYLVSFFIYLYCFLTHLVSHNPVPKPSSYEDDINL